MDQESPHLQKVMTGARRVSDWKAIHIPVRNSIVLYENGIWRVGNSAAFIDTVIGAGISIALQSGQLLSQAITGFSCTSSALFRHNFFLQQEALRLN